MINRNYLPYKSAREYADRGMAKWMGFFISEHTTAINTQGNTIDFSNNMDEDEKRLLLNQLYFFKGLSYLYTSTQREPYLGKVVDCTNDIIYFSTKQNILQISISDILKVSLAEELDYEQT